MHNSGLSRERYRHQWSGSPNESRDVPVQLRVIRHQSATPLHSPSTRLESSVLSVFQFAVDRIRTSSGSSLPVPPWWPETAAASTGKSQLGARWKVL